MTERTLEQKRSAASHQLSENVLLLMAAKLRYAKNPSQKNENLLDKAERSVVISRERLADLGELA